MLREKMPQVSETDQEAGTVANYVADVRVPAQVTVEQHAQVLNCPALLNGLPTDPHGDRGEVTGVLSGAKKDFGLDALSFRPWAWNHADRAERVDSMRWIR